MIQNALAFILLAGAPLAWQPVPPPVTAPEADYRIGSGDILKVVVYGHEDLTQTVVVQPDGSFTFPLVGRVKAADMTPQELEAHVVELLAHDYIRDPHVNVLIQEYRSRVVFVVGEVAKPGKYPLSGSMTVIEILSKAGPLGPNAGSEVVIVRPRTISTGPVLPSDVARGASGTPGAPSQKDGDVFSVNTRDIQAGHLESNLVLQPNDTVFIPVAPRVFVSGQVRNPGAFPFSPGTTVRQAISLAGGLTEDGSSGRVRVVREVNGKPKETKIRLDDRIEPGDTIIVKAKLF